jgi:hypothetical protein
MLPQRHWHHAAEPRATRTPDQPAWAEPLGLLHRERSGAEHVPFGTTDDGALDQVLRVPSPRAVAGHCRDRQGKPHYGTKRVTLQAALRSRPAPLPHPHRTPQLRPLTAGSPRENTYCRHPRRVPSMSGTPSESPGNRGRPQGFGAGGLTYGRVTERSDTGRTGVLRGCSLVVEHQLPKLRVRVRFSSPAPCEPPGQRPGGSFVVLTILRSACPNRRVRGMRQPLRDTGGRRRWRSGCGRRGTGCRGLWWGRAGGSAYQEAGEGGSDGRGQVGTAQEQVGHADGGHLGRSPVRPRRHRHRLETRSSLSRAGAQGGQGQQADAGAGVEAGQRGSGTPPATRRASMAPSRIARAACGISRWRTCRSMPGVRPAARSRRSPSTAPPDAGAPSETIRSAGSAKVRMRVSERTASFPVSPAPRSPAAIRPTSRASECRRAARPGRMR